MNFIDEDDRLDFSFLSIVNLRPKLFQQDFAGKANREPIGVRQANHPPTRPTLAQLQQILTTFFERADQGAHQSANQGYSARSKGNGKTSPLNPLIIHPMNFIDDLPNRSLVCLFI